MPALADDEEGDTRQFTDSARERNPVVTAFPSYPDRARRFRVEGEAVVCFMIDVDGRVIRASIKRSTDRIFEKPALNAIRASSFEPLRAGETLADSRTCRTYRFRLEPVVADNVESPHAER